MDIELKKKIELWNGSMITHCAYAARLPVGGKEVPAND